MSAARKPRPIGPQAVAATPAPDGESAEAVFDLAAFIESLPAGELMDLDEAAGGALAPAFAGGEITPNLKLMLAIAWIVRRRDQPRLTFRDVRAMKPDALADLLNSLDGVLVPKADSANNS